LDQTEGLRIGNVDSVQEGQEIQNAKERHQVKVDAPHELALGGVRRAGDEELIGLSTTSDAGMVRLIGPRMILDIVAGQLG
jgi:hypothetical protein